MDIKKNFTYHKPKDIQISSYEEIRDMAMRMAVVVETDCPVSRERSIALTKLEECVMWANAAVARHK